MTHAKKPSESAPEAYLEFDRTEWSRLRQNTPLTLAESDLAALRGTNDPVSLAEVTDVYLPLSRLLNLRVAASQQLHGATDTFLGRERARVPFVIGIAGSVAVGKSTTARILQALLSRWPDHPRVDLVTTDGFLFPNRTLTARGIMARKGFPESYDLRRLIAFLSDVKAGREAAAPVYSHVAYDVLPDRELRVARPDVLILEGLNVLQSPVARGNKPRLFVSDYFDFSIYVDADERHIRRWYVERFLAVRARAAGEPGSYLSRYAGLSEREAVTLARGVWRTVNGKNLRENIAPTRWRADLLLEKGEDHAVKRVRMRRI